MDVLMDVSGESLLPDIDDSLDPEALDAQVKEIMSLDVYQELIKEQIRKAEGDKGRRAEVSRMEVAKIIGMISPQAPVTKELRKLLRDPSAEVVRYAAESAGRLKRREFVPLLVGHLIHPSVREAAAQALRAYGESP
jgi:HEAT repeat protein